MKIACIGIGNMGSAIMKAVCKEFGGKNVTVTNRTLEKAKKFAQENDCNYAVEQLVGNELLTANQIAVSASDYVFLAVKPNMIKDVIEEIKPKLDFDTVIISMAAGISLETLSSFDDQHKFIRIMPNLPAKIGQSMTALCHDKKISSEKVNQVVQLLKACGKVEIVSENLMNCVTAISGSGPAYAFMFIEALADAAVSFGMPRNQAYIYASQTLKGSAEMVLETKTHPAVLKDGVCSPSGTTIEAVKALEENGFRKAVILGAEAAFNKSKSM